MNIPYEKASFKDFENIEGLDAYATAEEFTKYLDFLKVNGHLNYRIESLSPCGPEMDLLLPGDDVPTRCVCLVSNDYLSFSQHPQIKAAVIDGVQRFGTGSGASPAIGGHFVYHQQLEEKIAAFYRKSNAILYTTGYTANSATLQCLLHKEDLAILDMAVHASVYEGCLTTNVKTFLHNNMQMLEQVLKNAQDKYRTKMVIIDGVYSQDGDIAELNEIINLTHKYGAYLVIDDAHGIGVIGDTGRGVIEMYNAFDKVDIITGTFSKALGNIGGYVVASSEIVTYLKFQSKQHLFSTTATPAVMGILKAIDLVDNEPEWRLKLWDNIQFIKAGLIELGFDVGTTASAVIPVKVGDIPKTLEAGRLLLNLGVYANPIMYPAVSKKNSRIRLNIMAGHTKEQLTKVLEAFKIVDQQLNISGKQTV
ncbi:aminotransferase class I/II-fold pyridoxal phosphate-dependent enzyme [Mucilaginibacter rubeus]|uniref:Aminotransferase class I/II-fold pyridoxal phosphate-dependent enzyme n=1 Tax=Mucilaginibacter rubeus TaxID=2027860 RepID=A0AAE6JNH5_9SPHI|nr:MULTISPECIES: aminotransferase class I/II-fold pyridoxal phosphate-dependent enzyme [Mucilaginibacter]QEM07800.1 aminotransferase class I/II-fold pyridoxal phosphate-dependent enzyme [Mucilaginibacter rubeus]QEM20252.1 aminotransferase class I/II-fold pyridoxal phosphate-dependent enzyme [Mucilaginibacter gossypii]QTE43030.1 aminotransferase class I/II-fold pyridoxal phosphate-dependent enzyme [Mucilaginibacter rubeus]QTE49631.1 aminotransferase class I/II-fold pyridoxal phosphate-dependent 